MDTHRSTTMEFMDIKQTGLVKSYHIQFEQLVYRLRLYDSNVSETMLAAQFLIGLKEEIKGGVEMQLPESV